jgi:hypothetical protein
MGAGKLDLRVLFDRVYDEEEGVYHLARHQVTPTIDDVSPAITEDEWADIRDAAEVSQSAFDAAVDAAVPGWWSTQSTNDKSLFRATVRRLYPSP